MKSESLMNSSLSNAEVREEGSESFSISKVSSEILTVSQSSLYRSKSNAVKRASRLLNFDERENRIHKICSSSLFSNFEDELFQHNQEFKDIDVIEILYPRYFSLLKYWLRGRILNVSIFFTIWNILGFISTISICYNEFANQFIVFTFFILEVLFPLLLLFIHMRFIQTWKGDFSDNDSVIKLSTSNEFRKHLNLMLHYLNNIDRDDSPFRINLFKTQTSKYKTDDFLPLFPILFFLILFIVYVVFAATSVYSLVLGEYDKCEVLYHTTRLSYLPAFASIFISGVVLFLAFSTLQKTVWICHHLIRSWVDLYQPLQRLKIKELERFIQTNIETNIETNIDIINKPSKKNLTANNLGKMIRRDAYERYLFIESYIRETSKSWNFLLAFIFMYCIFISAIFLLGTVQFGSFAAVICLFVFIVHASLLVLTSVSLAFANFAMLKVQEKMNYNVPESEIYSELELESDNEGEGDMDTPITDYEILGGHQELLKFFSDNPIYWTVFGFAVTPTVLHTVIAGLVTSIAAAAFSYFSSNLQL